MTLSGLVKLIQFGGRSLSDWFLSSVGVESSNHPSNLEESWNIGPEKLVSSILLLFWMPSANEIFERIFKNWTLKVGFVHFVVVLETISQSNQSNLEESLKESLKMEPKKLVSSILLLFCKRPANAIDGKLVESLKIGRKKLVSSILSIHCPFRKRSVKKMDEKLVQESLKIGFVHFVVVLAAISQ